MADLPLDLPRDVVVFNTFVSLRSDFPEPAPRARSCPPGLARRTPGPVTTPDRYAAQEVSETTLVLHNLPLRSRASRLFSHLDSLGLKGRYNYVHLPTDVRTRMLRGYAFINFLTPADAHWCIARVEGTQIEGSGSLRTLTARVAAKQGIDANLAVVVGGGSTSRRKGHELTWVRVDDEMQPLQGRALVRR